MNYPSSGWIVGSTQLQQLETQTQLKLRSPDGTKEAFLRYDGGSLWGLLNRDTSENSSWEPPNPFQFRDSDQTSYFWGHQAWTTANLPREQGQFTPSLAFTSNNGTWSYAAQLGHYWRIDNFCWGNLVIRLSAKSTTGATALDIIGLPFPYAATDSPFPVIVVRTANPPAGKQFYAFGLTNQAAIRIRLLGTDTTGNQETDTPDYLRDTTIINCTFSYQI